MCIRDRGNSLFERLARAMNKDEWLEREEYASGDGRIRERSVLDREIQDWVGQLTGAEALRVLVDAGVPATMVSSIADLMADPHVVARGDFTTISDEVIGDVVVAAPKPLLSRTPGAIRSTAPSMGQHTDDVLQDVLGMSEADLGRLAASGVIERGGVAAR